MTRKSDTKPNKNEASNASHETADDEQGIEKKAIALIYDEVSAPTVGAKGEGDLAEQIIAIAREHGVPLYENPELVRSLARLELGDEIPELLYRVIAEIIAFAYHIRGKVPGDSNNDKNRDQNDDQDNTASSTSFD